MCGGTTEVVSDVRYSPGWCLCQLFVTVCYCGAALFPGWRRMGIQSLVAAQSDGWIRSTLQHLHRMLGLRLRLVVAVVLVTVAAEADVAADDADADVAVACLTSGCNPMTSPTVTAGRAAGLRYSSRLTETVPSRR